MEQAIEKLIEELGKVVCPKRDVCTEQDYDDAMNHAHCRPHQHNKNCDDENGCALKDSSCIPVGYRLAQPQSDEVLSDKIWAVIQHKGFPPTEMTEEIMDAVKPYYEAKISKAYSEGYNLAVEQLSKDLEAKNTTG